MSLQPGTEGTQQADPGDARVGQEEEVSNLGRAWHISPEQRSVKLVPEG